MSLVTVVILAAGLGIYFFIEYAYKIIAVLTMVFIGIVITMLIGRYDDKSIKEREKIRRELMGYDEQRKID